jgi:GMP synthase-like glutamine amidotransferase
MRIHCLLPTSHENVGHIATWASRQGHTLTRTLLCDHEPLPDVADIDWLIITHGLASVHDPDLQTWQDREKAMVDQAVDWGLPVLGLGRGAEMLSHVLGGLARPGGDVKFGWHPVTLSPQGRQCEFFQGFPETFLAFHWHDDTLGLPPRACRMAGSETCYHEAFVHGDCVVGLQFHLEHTEPHVNGLARRAELPAGPLVQTAEEVLAAPARFTAAHGLLERLLGVMESKVYSRWTARPHRVRIDMQPPAAAPPTSASTRATAPKRRPAAALS